MVEIIAQRYVLIGDPRAGGQSVVRRATDTEDGSTVAVKLLNGPHDQLLEEVFERETSALKSLQHPNIVRLLDSGIHNNTFFLVLEWAEKSFADVLSDGNPYEWDELANSVVRPLLSALSYAHLKGAEHRDIKPGNVLLRADQTPLLADFGISKLRNDIQQSNVTVAGFRSRPYAPPEEDSAIPYVRDVYSMGVLIIQALSATKIADFADIQPAVDGIKVPSSIRYLLKSCVSPDRNMRPTNGALLLAQFEDALKTAEGGVSRPTVVFLSLTESVRKQFSAALGIDTADEVRGSVLHDLSSEVFGEYRLDRETGFADRETMLLTGSSWRLTTKLAQDGNSLVVVNARMYDFETLESMRKRSLSLDAIVNWSCAQVRNPSFASSAIEKLQRALDDHEEARNNRDTSESTALDGIPNDIFESWIKLLQAREEIARGDLKAMRYSSSHRNGREAEFTLATTTELDLVGSEMEVVIEESGKRIARGEVIAQGGDEVTLRSAREFPRLPARGLLEPFLGPSQIALQRQRDAVSSIRDRTAARADLAELILNPGSIRAPDPVDVRVWRSELDGSKEIAVKAALGSRDLIIVQGPPGTGKTTFITELINQMLEINPNSRILIVSQTHVAVDNALERLDAAGVKNAVRLGIPDDPRVAVGVRHLLIDQQMSRWAKTVKRKAQAYINAKSNEIGIPVKYLQAALALQQITNISDEITRVEKEVVDKDKSDDTAPPGVDTYDEKSSPQDRLERLIGQRSALVREAEGFLTGELTLNPNLTRLDAAAAIGALLGVTGPGPTLLRVLKLQEEWLQRMASDENLEPSFLRTTNVIAGTCIGFLRHPGVRDLEIDLCIIDEASKATATEALVPMARAKRWILIGDASQLPPMDEDVLRSPELLAEYDLQPDFVKETLFSRFANEAPDYARFMLREQYRMIRPIGDLISSCFYGGDLHSKRTEGLRGYEILGKPILWIDTGSLGTRRREDSQLGGTSYANRAEARIIIERLKTIDTAIDKGYVGDPSEILKVLLVAPYRNQVEELARRLTTLVLKHLEIQVQSVDAVQGRETDITLFSVTQSNPEYRMGFLGEDYWRRINVALSRARFGLTIVGDAEFCRTSPGALRQVLQYMRANREDCEIRSAENA